MSTVTVPTEPTPQRLRTACRLTDQVRVVVVSHAVDPALRRVHAHAHETCPWIV